MLVFLSPGRLWAHPSLGRLSRLLGRSLDSCAQVGRRRGFLTHVPSVGKESGPLGKANRPARFWWERIGIVGAYLVT